MYNLSEYLATKTDKQVKALIKNRLIKLNKNTLFIIDNDHFPLNDVPRIKKQIAKAEKIEQDCIQWLRDAVYYVGESFWDSAVEESGLCLEGNCYEDFKEC